MSACWPLMMPPTAKAVLISLADNANDHGECWPALKTIAERTCFSERAVQNAIHWLEQSGALLADRSNGRHTRYHVTPQNFQTPAPAAPPQEMHPRTSCTPAADSPPQQVLKPPHLVRKPPQQVPSNRKEPSGTEKQKKERAAAPSSIPQPDGVTSQTWGDWLSLRKAKRAPVTETVLNHAKSEAGKAGMSLEAFLKVWCARGSQGLEASWLKPNERAGPAPQAPMGKTMTGIMALEALKNGLADSGSGDRNPAALVSEPRRLPGR